MQARPQLIVLAAMACGLPATIAAIVLLPWAAMFGIYGLIEAPVEAAMNLALVGASIFAIANYWYLASRTIKGLSYSFRWPFWLALVCSLVSGAIVFFALPLAGAALVVLPIAAATYHFASQQYVRQRHEPTQEARPTERTIQ